MHGTTIELIRGAPPSALLEKIAEFEAQTMQGEAALWGRAGLEQTLTTPHAGAAILFVEDQAAAYCLFSMVAGECEILQIATAPSLQRRGIGRSLLQAVLAYAAEHGCGRTLLEVRRGNLAARRLYESLGFSVDGVRRGYYRHGGDPPAADHDALLLSRLLPAQMPPTHSIASTEDSEVSDGQTAQIACITYPVDCGTADRIR